MSALATVAPPVAPPRAWFQDPKLKALTPLVVTPEGQVFGHLASWSSCHLESNALGQQCVRAPRSRNGYAGFHLGYVTTADGSDIPVGRIVAGAPHSDPVWGLDATLVHYSHSGWVGADVRAGEDQFGVWVAGALRPDVTPEQVRALKASPLSGDWRTDRISGELELVAALAVNSPGFAVPRPQALVASTGAVQSIFAVGTVARDSTEAAKRRREVKFKVIGFQMDGIRRGAGLPAPRTKPRPAPRRQAAELAAIVAGFRESALIASMGTPAASVQPWEGTIGAEGTLTGDGRLIALDALTWAQFPLPLRWAPADVGGHDGAVIVGRIDSVTRGPNGQILAKGVIDLGSAAGQEVARLIKAGMLSGVSMDLDAVDTTTAHVSTQTKGGTTTQPAAVTSAGRVRAATLVAIPAFDQARIGLVGEPTNAPPSLPPADSGTPEPAPSVPAHPDDDSGAEDGGSFALDCGCSDTLAAVSAPLSYVLTGSQPNPPGDLADLSDAAAFPPLEAFPGAEPVPTHRHN
jgi:hypothetical protein